MKVLARVRHPRIVEVQVFVDNTIGTNASPSDINLIFTRNFLQKKRLIKDINKSQLIRPLNNQHFRGLFVS